MMDYASLDIYCGQFPIVLLGYCGKYHDKVKCASVSVLMST